MAILILGEVMFEDGTRAHIARGNLERVRDGSMAPVGNVAFHIVLGGDIKTHRVVEFSKELADSADDVLVAFTVNDDRKFVVHAVTPWFDYETDIGQLVLQLRKRWDSL